ncbi:CD97 antigen-like [Dendronephthya gigantea]|uniref:CD97 antigen-like n=1 Tax=Dendronephthya gigantea TaxID=151771 RepID=UPI00106CB75D|nr:CD97 antigen-like [Dendronephthya gigantea]
MNFNSSDGRCNCLRDGFSISISFHRVSSSTITPGFNQTVSPGGVFPTLPVTPSNQHIEISTTTRPWLPPNLSILPTTVAIPDPPSAFNSIRVSRTTKSQTSGNTVAIPLFNATVSPGDISATHPPTPNSQHIEINTTTLPTTDVDECTIGIHNCDDRATCINTAGSFNCICYPGYTGDGIACVDIEECTLGIHNCDHQATCINTAGWFNCTCDQGYTGDGIVCVDIEECTLGIHNCDRRATCMNTVGWFNCTCDHSYTGDGITCEEGLQGTDIPIDSPCREFYGKTNLSQDSIEMAHYQMHPFYPLVYTSCSVNLYH